MLCKTKILQVVQPIVQFLSQNPACYLHNEAGIIRAIPPSKKGDASSALLKDACKSTAVTLSATAIE